MSAIPEGYFRQVPTNLCVVQFIPTDIRKAHGFVAEVVNPELASVITHLLNGARSPALMMLVRDGISQKPREIE